MSLTLLQIVNAVEGELGLPQSSTVVGNTDTTTVQLFYLANRALDDLRREHNWTVLTTEFNLAINPPVISTGNITKNSSVITNIPTTVALQAQYFTVSGPSIPVPARIASVDSATQITMDMQATGTTIGGTLTFSKDTYELPSDFDWYQNQTFWDRTNRWPLFGPDSPQTSQWLQSGIVPITPRRHFRQIGPFSNRFRIWPPPAELANPYQFVFEYVSSNCVWVKGGVTGDFSADFGPDFDPAITQFSSSFANDTDVPLLDAQAIVMGLKWQMWRIKGFNYQDLKNEWVDYVERLKARDGAAQNLRMVSRPTSILISPANVQDGNWPGPTTSN